MKVIFWNVTLVNKWKMRFLRKVVKWKNPLQCCMALIVALGILYGAYTVCTWCYYGVKYFYHAFILDDLYSTYNSSTKIGPTFKFYESGPYGYIEDTHTEKRILKDVTWVSGVNEDDSLLCFASHGKRGYFNRNTGDVPIPADRYYKAWLFSEGVACVMEADSTLKFINSHGEVVIDNQFKYSELAEDIGFIFYNGHCPMIGSNDKWGLIDKNGKWEVSPEYDGISITNKGWWVISNEDKVGVLNDSLKLVLSPIYREVDVLDDDGLEVLNMNFERQLFDYQGKILKNFMFTDLRDLWYKIPKSGKSDDEYEQIPSDYKEYHTTYSFNRDIGQRVGLLGPDGNPVTPPSYLRIEALGPDRFRCYYNDCLEGEGLSVLINSKGTVIHP